MILSQLPTRFPSFFASPRFSSFLFFTPCFFSGLFCRFSSLVQALWLSPAFLQVGPLFPVHAFWLFSCFWCWSDSCTTTFIFGANLFCRFSSLVQSLWLSPAFLGPLCFQLSSCSNPLLVWSDSGTAYLPILSILSWLSPALVLCFPLIRPRFSLVVRTLCLFLPSILLTCAISVDWARLWLFSCSFLSILTCFRSIRNLCCIVTEPQLSKF
jgi:hypothetical protein